MSIDLGEGSDERVMFRDRSGTPGTGCALAIALRRFAIAVHGRDSIRRRTATSVEILSDPGMTYSYRGSCCPDWGYGAGFTRSTPSQSQEFEHRALE
jgi:hypothetical protein